VSSAIDLASCTEEQLWRHVASHLEASGLRVVLVGGAVVSIYSGGLYRSGDLDFVPGASRGQSAEAAMAEIGFERVGSYYRHPRCAHLFVQFVSGPLGIGDDLGIEPVEVEHEGVTLRILSPTDCVRDRLASYIHFEARECLDQAVLVARARQVDWSRIEEWCRAEGRGGVEAFEQLTRLASTLRPGGD
jgi:hypothetical protein